MLHEVKITSANGYLPEVRSLYETAFPKEEQIPYDDLVRLIERMPLDFVAYYDDEKFVRLTIVYPHAPFNWFWYFAVQEEMRGQGYGQQILSHLIEQYKGRTCILDMESPDQPDCPNPEQRRRRHSFYLRNGFRDTKVYRSFEGITYTILMLGEGTFTKQDYDDIITDLQRFWWRKE